MKCSINPHVKYLDTDLLFLFDLDGDFAMTIEVKTPSSVNKHVVFVNVSRVTFKRQHNCLFFDLLSRTERHG